MCMISETQAMDFPLVHITQFQKKHNPLKRGVRDLNMSTKMYN